MGKVTIDAAHVDEFKAAAIKWRKDYLAMPSIGLEDALKGMTLRTGIRYKEAVGAVSLGAQVAPYKATRVTSKDVEILWREAETYFGSVNLEFEPNAIISQVIGHAAANAKGEGQKNTETARLVLGKLASDISENLYNVLWSAVRNANGDTTADLFNGFDTITTAEITAGKIAAAKGNYLKLDTALTATNAVDVIKAAIRKADKRLLRQGVLVYCSYDVMEKYQDAYLATHAATPYNTTFDQMDVEGTGGKAKFFPMVNKEGSKYIHVSMKQNMLICVDQMSDEESVAIEHFSAFTLNFVMTMFFGVQFESIDSRRLFVIELADSESGSGAAE